MAECGPTACALAAEYDLKNQRSCMSHGGRLHPAITVGRDSPPEKPLSGRVSRYVLIRRGR